MGVNDIYIRPASMPWFHAAKRLTGRDCVVAFASGYPLEPDGDGTVLMFRGETVIVLRETLPILWKISTLVHEAAHIEFDSIPELKRHKGKVGIWGSRFMRMKSEDQIIQYEQTYMRDEFMPRLESLKRSTPRPHGWWSGEIARGGQNRRERDYLSCIG